MLRFSRNAVLAALISGSIFAQTPSILVNPDFEQGQAGERPPGWLFGFTPKLAYSALTVADTCYSAKQCAMIRSNVVGQATGHSFLYQYVDAKPYRGMKFRFRVAVRTRVSGLPNGAGLLVRIHRVSGGSCFLDNMNERRITGGDWAFYEITGDVCADARDLELGMQLWGSGSAWMDDASLMFANSAAELLPKITSVLPKH